MTDQLATRTGTALMDKSLDNSFFEATNIENLVYSPAQNGAQSKGLAQLKYSAVGGTAPLWKTVSYYLNRQDVIDVDNPGVAFDFNTQLYGVVDSGSVELIAEDIVTDCSTTKTSERRGFDLIGAACHSKFHVASNNSMDNKIHLNLPYRSDYFENIQLKPVWYATSWSHREVVRIIGTCDDGVDSDITVLIAYDSVMNTDFSDLRFTGPDGVTLLDFGISYKENGYFAVCIVKVEEVPLTNEAQNIFCYFGNNTASSVANLIEATTFEGGYSDDFEDGKVIGRSPPYENWNNLFGVTSIESSSPISGSYSLKHSGNGDDDRGNVTRIQNSLQTYRATFKFKVGSTGSGSTFFLFIPRYFNYNNLIRIYTYWDGVHQKIDLQCIYDGSSSEISVPWMSSQLTTGITYSFDVLDTGSHITVKINGTTFIDSDYDYPYSTSEKAVGANRNNVGIWDDIIITPYVTSYPTVIQGSNTRTILDDFNDNSINTTFWNITPNNGAITEMGQQLVMNCPASPQCDWWGTAATITCPLILTYVPCSDWVMTVKVQPQNPQINSDAGITLYQDGSNAFLFTSNYDASYHGLKIDKFVGGTPTLAVASNSVTNSPIWLQIVYESYSGTYYFKYSTTGAVNSFITLYSTTSLGITPTKIGLFAKQWGSTASTTYFDDFSLKIQYYTKFTADAINVDSMQQGKQVVTFTLPDGWADKTKAYIKYKEYTANEITGNKISMSAGDIVQMGYNSLDAYKTLLLKFNANCNANYKISIDDVRIDYEV